MLFKFCFIMLLFFASLAAENTLKINHDTPSLTTFNLEHTTCDHFVLNTKNIPWKSTKNSFYLVPNSSHWYKISIYNDSTLNINRIIYLTESNIITTEFYESNQQKIVSKSTANTIQKSNQNIYSNHPAYNIELHPHEQCDIYIHLQTPVPAFQEIWVLTPFDFAKYDKYSSIMFATYFIISFGAFFYAFILAIVFKNKQFLFYSLYVFSTLIWVLTNAGYICLLFSVEIAWFLSTIVPISYIFLIALAKSLLQLKENAPIFNKILTFFQIVLFLLFMIMLKERSLGLILLYYLGIIFLAVAISILIFLCFKLIDNFSKIFLLAVFPMLVAILTYLLASVNFIPPNFFYQYLNLVGFFIEIFGFAILILIQMVYFKREKEHEQIQLLHLKNNYFKIQEEYAQKSTKNAILKTELLLKDTLLNETHHRIKNNLQLIISILSMQTDSNVNTTYTLKEAISRIQSIASIHEMLYHYSSPTTLQIKNYFENLTEYFVKTYSTSKNDLFISMSVPEYSIDIQYGLYFGILITELLTNSIKHHQTGSIKIQVKIRIHKNIIYLYVKDNGPGILSENLSSKDTLGLNLIRSIISYFPYATYKFKSNNGTIFLLSCQLPI